MECVKNFKIIITMCDIKLLKSVTGIAKWNVTPFQSN